jgi:hypothetical protein
MKEYNLGSVENYDWNEKNFDLLKNVIKQVIFAILLAFEKKGFIHGLDFYDSYVCISKECEIDIVDDFEYLCDSNFFSENFIL